MLSDVMCLLLFILMELVSLSKLSSHAWAWMWGILTRRRSIRTSHRKWQKVIFHLRVNIFHFLWCHVSLNALNLLTKPEKNSNYYYALCRRLCEGWKRRRQIEMRMDHHDNFSTSSWATAAHTRSFFKHKNFFFTGIIFCGQVEVRREKSENFSEFLSTI